MLVYIEPPTQKKPHQPSLPPFIQRGAVDVFHKISAPQQAIWAICWLAYFVDLLAGIFW
jgi:hypothetical protein